MEYKVGDKIRIVSEWNKKTNQNENGLMNKWLGKVMTISKVLKKGIEICYKMVEDQDENCGLGWFWNEHCIAGLAEETPAKKHSKVVITTDGKTTLARLYEDGKIVKTATAKCHPEDTFDAVIGAKIAFERLLGEEKKEPADVPFENCKERGASPVEEMENVKCS